jgi:hypothetical protein
MLEKMIAFRRETGEADRLNRREHPIGSFAQGDI